MTDLFHWKEYPNVEKPFLELLQKLEYSYLEKVQIDLERKGRLQDVVLVNRLKNAINKLNPWINESNLDKAVKRLIQPTLLTLLERNQEVYTDLIHYFSLEQDIGEGKKSQTIKIIDFENPSNNEFLVTNQFSVYGPKINIRADIVIFVNGLPLVVVECKSSVSEKSDLGDAKRQLVRYQRDTPQLFYYNQFLIVTLGQAAEAGAIEDKEVIGFRPWKDPYPMKLDDLENLLQRKASPQDILIAGMLTPENLLDLIQNFIVYDVVGGRTVKKIARYQQFRAVNKAINRILKAKTLDERGGVVWHTQGSGKSLTMVFLSVKLRRLPTFKNPMIVVVTDRIDLDKQISSTFRQCGFPNPARADSIDDL